MGIWGARHRASAGADLAARPNPTGREDEEGPVVSRRSDAEPPARLSRKRRLEKHRPLFTWLFPLCRIAGQEKNGGSGDKTCRFFALVKPSPWSWSSFCSTLALARSCLLAARPEGACGVCAGETSHSASGGLRGTETNRCLLNAVNWKFNNEGYHS